MSDRCVRRGVDDLRAERDRLAAWKREAIMVLTEWEAVFQALGAPGRLGESKAAASLAAIRRLVPQPECETCEGSRVAWGSTLGDPEVVPCPDC